MLARQLGYVQLAEPVRFTHGWERDATLRLRAGDTSVLAVYDGQGRLRGGDAEEAAELACQGWLADHLAGKDALLLARTEEQARELSRRVRGELVHLGIVQAGTAVRLRHGAAASEGDLIMARRNDRRITAGEPGRWLTNRDVLRVEGARGRLVIVRRLAGRNRRTGEPVWSLRFEVPRTYVLLHADLAYATTLHAAQGRTVDVGHLLVDGTGDRQGLYVGLSRGREANYAYCVTSARAGDPAAGSSPAPELGRAREIARKRAGLPPRQPAPTSPGAGEVRRHPVSVLAETLGRDGAALSATETMRSELSNADHLGVLGSIWYDLARREQAARFERLLRQHLTAVDAKAALADPACTWLWRTLREAEAAGLDAGQVLQSAIAARSLRGARHIARVIDARIRRATENTVPAARQPWTELIPQTSDPEVDRFLTELAQAMEDRVTRIGEHVAQAQPSWVINALGEPPQDPAQRSEWTARAARLGAYREMYGYDSPADAIGPEPGRASPEARADWHTALATLGRVEGADLRGYSDSQLRLRRSAWKKEAAWAPPYVAEDLRLARLQARTAFENLILEQHEIRAAADPGTAARHEQLAAAWHDMQATATRVADDLVQADETRRQWQQLTEPTRQASLAADLELRRRHPEQAAKQAAAEVREPAGDQTQELSGETGWDSVVARVASISEEARTAQEKLDELRDIRIPSEDGKAPYLGPAWTLFPGRDCGAIVQAPQPGVSPASEVLRRANAHQSVHEPEAENV
jgi:hypothetical protein